jgi:alpha-L-fucosidase
MRRREAIPLLGAAGGGLLLPGLGSASSPRSGHPDPTSPAAAITPNAPAPADMSWWREARFGLFIHWGPVSLKGTEIGWSRGREVPIEEYDALYRSFNPTAFDAAAWARIAREAGMGYVVLTTKHHDGFCLWDSPSTDYDIMSAPFGRDLSRELAEACRAEGLVFCAYHSICDWRHPDYPMGSPGGETRKPGADMERYNAYLKAQVGELLETCGPLGVLWFDGEWEEPWTEERGRDLYRHCRTLQPSVLVNNRVGTGREGMSGITTPGAFAGDFDTPEQEIGRYQDDRPWESCITICEQWAWKPDDTMKTLEECVRTLASCAGGDGNLLLNVGPMPNGEIEPRQVERLREIGAWLRRNGEAVYGTRGGPFKPGAWGASTRRGRTVFLHVFEHDRDGWLRLPPVDRRVVAARAPGGESTEWRQTSDGMQVRVPVDPGSIVPVVALQLDGPAATLPAV